MKLTVSQPIYLSVVVWGDEHISFFLNYLLPSMLSHGNIPSIENKEDSKFFICTTFNDWQKIKKDKNIEIVSQYILTELIEIKDPSITNNKYLSMSEGQKKVSILAYENKANAIYLTPDSVFTSDAICKLQKYVNAGYDLVYSIAVRYNLEDVLPKIDDLRVGANSPLDLDSKYLASLALDSMHDETKCFEFNAPYFSNMPMCLLWRVGSDGVIFHSLSWAPLIINYGKINKHDTSTLDNWTMDGDYVYKNFGSNPKYFVIEDATELMLMTFTSKSERPGYMADNPFESFWYTRIPIISSVWKINRIRWMLNNSGVDVFKYKLFLTPIKLYKKIMESKNFHKSESRAQEIINKARKPLSKYEKLIIRLIELSHKVTFWPFRLIHSPKEDPVSDFINKIFMNQSGVGTISVLRLSKPICRGKWYWEIHSNNVGDDNSNIGNTVCIGLIDKNHSLHHELGSCGHGWGWRADGTLINLNKKITYGYLTCKVNKTFMLAYDAEGNNLWIGIDGQWFGNGNPQQGSNPSITGLSKNLIAAVSSRHGEIGTALLNIKLNKVDFNYSIPDGYLPLLEYQSIHKNNSNKIAYIS